MKILLWAVLAVSVVANAATNLLMPGGAGQITLQLVTGLVAVGSVAGLVAVRRQRA
ncbi:hypothetical protein AB0I61_28810 [Polymorphospora rubra]|uniref:hypothetical protein n=1 Tax=Polymorphospora rubra TaxID=338584 RepID=UPI00340EA35B